MTPTVRPSSGEYSRSREKSSATTHSLIANSLNAGQLGTRQVIFFAGAAATFLTVVTGVVPTAFAITGALGIPLAFLLVGAVLWLFTAGFVAMSGHISNAGAFYAYVSQGLSRRMGVGAAWLALTSYNLLQVGLYGIMGVAAAPLADQYLQISAPWWAYAVIAWAITAVLGLMKVDLNGRVLAVLFVAEVAIIVVISIANLLQPGPEGVSFAALKPSAFSDFGWWGALVIMGLLVLGYVGFESAAVYSEESRDTGSTVRAGMYWTIGLSCAVYVLAAWGMTVAVGPSQTVAQSQTDGADLFFNLASERMGSMGDSVAATARVLLLTSVQAALISFHATVARYAYALGREHVLPTALARTSLATGAPWVASIAQSVLGLTVISVCALAGIDPLVQLFFYAGTVGGLGVLTLLLITSVAVSTFFTRARREEGLWASRTAPRLAVVALGLILVAAVTNLDGMLGVPSGHPLTLIIPIGMISVLILGFLWGNYLRLARPDVFEKIGRGADSARTQAVDL